MLRPGLILEELLLKWFQSCWEFVELNILFSVCQIAFDQTFTFLRMLGEIDLERYINLLYRYLLKLKFTCMIPTNLVIVYKIMVHLVDYGLCIRY